MQSFLRSTMVLLALARTICLPDPSLAGPTVAGTSSPGLVPLLVAPAVALPMPVTVRGQEAPVTLENTIVLPELGRRLARFRFAPIEAPVPGRNHRPAGYRSLAARVASGEAAGNRGDLYDNRDRGHSALKPSDYPLLAHTVYDAAARAAGLDYGLGDRMLFDAPTIGNSSTALTAGPFWRSQARLALTGGDGSGPLRLAQNYRANHIYVYPEHRDHDPEHGDLVPANTPYMLISQGSSRSDRPHLEALAMILAAFRPETKARLIETGLVAPTVQMVFRRGQKGVLGLEGYLSGMAHPAAFPGESIDTARMVALAGAIEAKAIPPAVRIDVREETPAPEAAARYGGLDERLFDTESAIARIWRSPAWRREMVVSAEATKDPAGHDLRFVWSVLRGDPARTRVTPLDPEGRRARITVEWQDPRPVPGRRDVTSARVDIGVFADNGRHLSAPAFVSILLPAHETRRYEAGRGGRRRIAEIDRSSGKGVYVDPLVFPRMPWRDDYVYDAAGGLAGWTRQRGGGRQDYTAAGARILTRDAEGRPLRVEEVRYRLARDRRGLPRIEEEGTGHYRDLGH